MTWCPASLHWVHCTLLALDVVAWGDERDVSSVVSHVVRLLWLRNRDEVGIRRVSFTLISDDIGG